MSFDLPVSNTYLSGQTSIRYCRVIARGKTSVVELVPVDLQFEKAGRPARENKRYAENISTNCFDGLIEISKCNILFKVAVG